MASSITFSGLGSGLDTRAIIDALLAAERVPITQLQSRKALAQQKIDLLGAFDGLIETLRAKAATLGAKSSLLSFGVTASVAGIAGFAANGTAAPGSHTLQSVSLASADRWAFDRVGDPDLDLASANGQTVSFSYDGTTYNVAVAQTSSSLNELASAINTAANGKVGASVVNTGTSAVPSWRLVLTGASTGASHRIQNIASTITGLTIDGTPPTAAGVAVSADNLTVANNAVAVIDGLSVTRESNDFNDVITGVSITLQQADPATTVAFTVATDKAAIKQRLQEFVDAYNAVIEFIGDQQSYDAESGAGGPLFGDGALRRIRDVLDDTLFGQSVVQVGADTSGYGTLRLLGLEAGSDGKLSIDATVLDQKMAADLDRFTDFFVDRDGFDNGGAALGSPGYYLDITADTGFGDDLDRALGAVVEAYGDGTGQFFDGVIEARSEALGDEIELYDERIEARERRLEQLEQRLVARFAALESLLAQLNAQSAYLDQHLAPKTSRDD